MKNSACPNPGATARVLVLTASLLAAFSASAQLEFYNGFDPDRPTIIATHGWMSDVNYPDTFGRSPTYVDYANCIGWEWNADFLNNLVQHAHQSGEELAQSWHDYITASFPDYDQPIQFAGHSLGTHLMCEAAIRLQDFGRNDPHNMGRAYQLTQLTLVDGAPAPDTLQHSIDEVLSNPIIPLKLDSYWSPLLSGGLGSSYRGPITNVKVPMGHSDIWNWYFDSLDDAAPGQVKAGAQYSIIGIYAHLNPGRATGRMVAGSDTPLDGSDDVFAAHLGN